MNLNKEYTKIIQNKIEFVIILVSPVNMNITKYLDLCMHIRSLFVKRSLKNSSLHG